LDFGDVNLVGVAFAFAFAGCAVTDEVAVAG